MLDITDIDFFSQLSPEGIEALRRASDLRSYPSGSVICRKGDEGKAFYAIASGGVRFVFGEAERPGRTSIFLGPGKVFGEMSLLSGMPVSGTIVAVGDTFLHVLPKKNFLQLFETHPALHRALIQMLISRIRHRSSVLADTRGPSCTIILVSPGCKAVARFQEGLFRAVEHYAPGSLFVDASHNTRPAHSKAADVPGVFPPPTRPVIRACPATRHKVYAVDESTDWHADLIGNWRASGEVGRVLVLFGRCRPAHPLRSLLEKADVVLVQQQDDGTAERGLSAPEIGAGSEKACFFRFGSRKEQGGPNRHGPWSFHVPLRELERTAEELCPSQWDRSAAPNLDWVARWITGREVGIALGAGGAYGFAHLGVLEVLEQSGVNVDYLCGTSMGGAVALACAKSRDVRAVIEQARDIAGGNQKIIDFNWFPRSSLLAGKKHQKAALGLYGNMHIADFEKPAAAVAADLVQADRFVLEQGPAAVAARATTAIPGIFPPVSLAGRLLVDGGLVSRVPVDLLFRRGCGLKIAVIVVPGPQQIDANAPWNHQHLKRRIDRFLGFRYVIAGSWQLLGWRQSISEAQSADIIIESRAEQYVSYNFSAIDRMIESGRKAALQKLDVIQESVASLLQPGAP